MEIKITHMVIDGDEMPFLSGSVAELGENAGKVTWQNSLKYAEEHALLKTPEQIQQARDYFKEFGAWSSEEIAAWSAHEVNALLVQFIAGDIREFESFDSYEEYQAASESGSVSGNLFRGDDGHFYFYVGN